MAQRIPTRRLQVTPLAEEAPKQANNSLQIGINCLLEVVASAQPLGARELAARFDLDPTRIHRYLGTLTSLGLLSRTPNRKFMPGPGIHVLAAMSLRKSRLLACALPHLRELARKSGRLASLGVLWQNHVCYLFYGGPDRTVEDSLAGTDLYPAEQSSIGLVLLAARPPEEVLQVMTSAGMPRERAEKLIHQLLDVRVRQYAVNPEGSSIAVSVGTGPAAGLALGGGVREKEIPALLEMLRATAFKITTDLNRA